MATTTNYSWTTPDDTDLVKDGAAAIRTLGSSADTTTKNLNPETTLGDLSFRSSTTDVNTRIGIGSSGQNLTVVAGVPAWATPASSAPTSASADVQTTQSTSSTSYTDLTTAGPAVTITTGTKALVIINSFIAGSGAFIEVRASFEVSGATTIAASNGFAIYAKGDKEFRMAAATRFSTLTAGSNTFTMKYKTNSGTGTFANREIIVIDLGS